MSYSSTTFYQGPSNFLTDENSQDAVFSLRSSVAGQIE
jgi:hypothetical protein